MPGSSSAERTRSRRLLCFDVRGATHLGRRASRHQVAGGLCPGRYSSDEVLREFRDLVEVLLDIGQGDAVAVGLF